MRLYEQLLRLEEEALISFHVPGHKYNARVQEYYDKFSPFLHMDITEIPGSDDLHDPHSCIEASQNYARDIYGSLESHYLVNGTTSGIYAMIMATSQPGDTFLLQRDCHKAVYQGLFLGRVTGICLQPRVSKSLNIPLGMTLEDIKAGFRAHPEAKGILLTYPNYYGIACDLEAIVAFAHSIQKLVLIDGAHGAHLCLNNALPKCAVECGADVVVQSAHKSLPVMTQASLLHVGSHRVDRSLLKRMLKLHQTSSPSYVLMASLDIGLTIVHDHGRQLMADVLGYIEGIHGKNKGCFLEEEDLEEGFFLDKTKMVYKGVASGHDPRDLEKYLRSQGIQIEFSNENVGVFVASMMNTCQDFNELSKKMENMKLKCYSGNENKGYTLDLPIVMSISKAYYKPWESIDLSKAVGRVAKDYIIPYPPGIPLLVPGQEITSGLVQYLQALWDGQENIIGLNKHVNQALQIEVIVPEENQ